MGLFRGDPADGSKTTVWAGGSRTVLNFVHAGRRRKKLIAVIAGLLTAVAGIAIFVTLRYLKAQAATRVIDGYSSLSRCLLGNPLREGELASMRYRAIQLTSLTGVDLARAAEGPWPDRCAVHAHQLNEGLEKSALADDGAGKDLVASSLALASAIEAKDNFWKDISKEVDKAFDDAKKANLALEARPNVSAPPEAAAPLHADSLPSSAQLADRLLDEAGVVVEAHPGSVTRFIVHGRGLKRPASMCVVGADALTCQSLPDAVDTAAKGGLELAGTADDEAAPLVFAGARGAGGVFRSDKGERFEVASALSGHAAKDGAVTLLAQNGSDLEIFRSGERNKERVGPGGRLTLEDPARDARLLWNDLLFVASDPDKKLLFVAGKLDPQRKRVDKIEPVGPLGDAARKAGRALEGCKSGATMVVRLHSASQAFLSFNGGAGWSKPLPLGARDGALSCDGKAAIITHVVAGEGGPLSAKVGQERCTAEECQKKSVLLSEMLVGEVTLGPQGSPRATTLAGKLLVVWQADHRGGVRLRIGSPDALAKAADVIVFDDLVGGKAVQAVSTVTDMRLIGGADVAVLLLYTNAGVYALRVNPDGVVTPFDVRWK